MPEVVLQARYDWMGEAIEKCARKQISFGDLCRLFSSQGYKTTSLYEMVRAAEATLSHTGASE